MIKYEPRAGSKTAKLVDALKNAPEGLNAAELSEMCGVVLPQIPSLLKYAVAYGLVTVVNRRYVHRDNTRIYKTGPELNFDLNPGGRPSLNGGRLENGSLVFDHRDVLRLLEILNAAEPLMRIAAADYLGKELGSAV